MLAFYREYPSADVILPQSPGKLTAMGKMPQPAAQLPDVLFWSIPWFHHVILMEKVKDLSARRWYMEQTLANGWSRNTRAN